MYEQYAKIRDSRGLTDYEVAKAGGFSRSILTAWKNGKSAPSKTTRYKIAQALHIPQTDNFVGNVNGDGFLIESNDAFRLGQNYRIATYAIKLADGGIIELTPEQLQELNKAVDAYIKVWVDAHNIKRI